MPDPRKIANPKTVNQVLADRGIRHGVFLTRLAGGEANWIEEQLRPLRAEIMRQISPILTQLESGEVLTEADQRLIARAADETERVTREYLQEILPKARMRLAAIGVSEADFEKRLFQRAMPIEWNFRTPPDDLIRSLVENPAISGKHLETWFSDLSKSARVFVNDQLEKGMLAGESVDDMVRRIRGTRKGSYKDGVLYTTTRHARQIVRSGVMKASNRARQAFHQQNEDIIKGYEVVLTLDSRTCMQCVDMESQNPYELNNYPDTPFHVGCRCLVVAVTKSWQELGIDLEEMEPGTRAAMGGEVPDTMTYEDWFKRQSAADQKDILGASRYELFKQGKPVTAFADRGQILTLDQLRGMEPDLFDFSGN